MGSRRFPKSERLTSKKTMELLFKQGTPRNHFPLKFIALRHPEATRKSHQVLISVPVRKFSRAVDRNTLKRRIREGFRQHKSLLPVSPPFCLAYIYLSGEILPSDQIHQAVRRSLALLQTPQ